MDQEQDWMRRAMAAYFRKGPQMPIPGSGSAVRAVGGLKYVHLCNGGQTLAVYRVDNQGRLKGLKRWPKELDRFA